MKKVILLFVAAITFSGTFVSCSNDDEASLVGKWAIYKTGGLENGVEILSNYTNGCSSNKDYIEFKSNGTYTEHIYDSSCSEYNYTSNYTRNGNTITLGTESSETATIMQLSGSTLKIKYSSENFSDGYGITVFQKIN